LGNGERPQFLQLESLHHPLDQVESVLHKVCLSSPLPIGDLYCMLAVVLKSFMFTASRARTLITTPPLPAAPSAPPNLPACPPQDLRRLPFTQANFLIGLRLRVSVEAMRQTLVPAGSASTRTRWKEELQEIEQ
jgi:hypothetical protein